MSYRTLINKFTTGELDPKFLGEVDYEGYRKGARRLRNALCTPQGSAQRRFGSLYVNNITKGATADSITDRTTVKIIPFEFNSEESYFLIIKDDGIGGAALDIYSSNTLVATIATLGTYTTASIQKIRWVQDVNKVFLLHEDYPPLIVQRTSLAVWTSFNAVFSFYPSEDFSVQDDAADNYTNNGTTFTPNAMDATTITASTAVFTSNHAGYAPNGGGIFIGNGGIFRIVSVNGAGTVATGYSTEDFADTSAIKGAESYLAERAWGNGEVIGGAPAGVARGYPRHGAFFQSRLVLGGSPSSPGTVYASEVKDYLSFNNSDSDPASGWGVEAGITGTDFVQDIISTKSLVLLTNKGASATSILLDTATTPGNVFLNTQGQENSRNMDGTLLNNQVLYADIAGNTVWSMTYDIPDSGYTVSNASILSAHLIRQPIWSDVFDPIDIDGRYYLLVNEDGTMAVLNSILEQNINAWTLCTTIGEFVNVACVQNTAMVLVSRQTADNVNNDGQPTGIYKVDSTFTVFREIENSTPTIIMRTNEDYLLIGNQIPFTKVDFDFVGAALADLDLTFEFLTDTGSWEEFTPTDNTDGFTQNGTIEWIYSDVSNWKSQPIAGTNTVYGDEQILYWVRIQRTLANSLILGALVNTIKINTKKNIFLEQLSFSQYMDCTINGSTVVSSPSGVLTNLIPLAGQNIFVFGDDFPLGTFYVDENGNCDLGPLNGNLLCRVGLDYKPLIVPMPVVAILQNGYMVYDPQKIKSLYIDFYESLGITVQGQNLPQVPPGEFMTEEAPVPTSDFYYVPIYAGWNPRVEIVISQSYPAPMLIRGICYEVEIN